MSKQQQKFLLDANVFIEAHRRYYSFDICPGFWACLLHYNKCSIIYSIDRVRDELKSGDQLGQWIKDSVPSDMFFSTDDSGVTNWYANIMQWVYASTQFNDEAKAEFAKVADGWLIAYAKSNKLTIVTHEVYNPKIKSKVPIPNICRELNVVYVDTFMMLRIIKAQFKWKAN